MRRSLGALALAALSAALAGSAAARPGAGAERRAARELGQVHWWRDYAGARAEAARSRKPLLVLFDEVPGCSTCVGYGEQVLSDPRLRKTVYRELRLAPVQAARINAAVGRALDPSRYLSPGQRARLGRAQVAQGEDGG